MIIIGHNDLSRGEHVIDAWVHILPEGVTFNKIILQGMTLGWYFIERGLCLSPVFGPRVFVSEWGVG